MVNGTFKAGTPEAIALKYLISLDFRKISTKLETESENRSKMCLFTLLILIL